MDGKKKLDAWISDPDISLTLQGSPGACEALQDDLRSISDAYKAMEAERDALRDALTPSAAARAAYEGEFHMGVTLRVRGQEDYRRVPIPWTTIKDIMSAILERAIHQKESLHEG